MDLQDYDDATTHCFHPLIPVSGTGTGSLIPLPSRIPLKNCLFQNFDEFQGLFGASEGLKDHSKIRDFIQTAKLGVHSA